MPIPPMPGDEISKDLLIKQIEAAFAHVNRRGGTTLHQASAIEGHANEQEVLDTARFDTDQHWTEIPGATLEEFCVPLWSFIDAKGWVYYLPAFMRWSLQRIDQGHEMWQDELAVNALAPRVEDSPPSKKRSARDRTVPTDENFDALTASHRRVCARYLRYMGWQQQSVAAMLYYQEYWHQFDT